MKCVVHSPKCRRTFSRYSSFPYCKKFMHTNNVIEHANFRLFWKINNKFGMSTIIFSHPKTTIVTRQRLLNAFKDTFFFPGTPAAKHGRWCNFWAICLVREWRACLVQTARRVLCYTLVCSAHMAPGSAITDPRKWKRPEGLKPVKRGCRSKPSSATSSVFIFAIKISTMQKQLWKEYQTVNRGKRYYLVI